MGQERHLALQPLVDVIAALSTAYLARNLSIRGRQPRQRSLFYSHHFSPCSFAACWSRSRRQRGRPAPSSRQRAATAIIAAMSPFNEAFPAVRRCQPEQAPCLVLRALSQRQFAAKKLAEQTRPFSCWRPDRQRQARRPVAAGRGTRGSRARAVPACRWSRSPPIDGSGHAALPHRSYLAIKVQLPQSWEPLKLAFVAVPPAILLIANVVPLAVRFMTEKFGALPF